MNNIIDAVAYDHFVVVDVDGITGTDGLIGRVERPVNNISDALKIIKSLKINKICFTSNFILDKTVNISNCELHGLSKNKIILTIEPGCILNDCSIHNLIVQYII